MSSPNGVAVLAGLGAAAVIGGLSWIFSRGEQKSKIQQELLQFYSREVQIPSHDMKEAKRVVAVIATKLKKKLEEMMWNEHKIECNKWMYTGSSYEGLKVIAPDEFDIMVAFDMRNDTPQPSFLGSLKGRFKICNICKWKVHIAFSGSDEAFSQCPPESCEFC
ncbi:uncharacterized protein LOC144444239 [Glandiceps talaboti]